MLDLHALFPTRANAIKLVADLHIHSHYSRTTSKNLNFEHLYKWAQIKGVHVVGTGDIFHPGWLQERCTTNHGKP